MARGLTSASLPKHRSDSDCFDLVPLGAKWGWLFSGASISARRILCCCLDAVRTVRVSPSAMATTFPLNVSACATDTKKAHVAMTANFRAGLKCGIWSRIKKMVDLSTFEQYYKLAD